MPARLFLSSGDLVADRRYDFARDLQLRGDLEAAADLMAQAVELAPGFASAWFALGEMRQQFGDTQGAIDAFRAACAADAEDRHGARLRLIRLGADPVGEMSASYVRTLFDQYAPKFEAALVGDLGYRGPELLLRSVLMVRHGARQPPSFRHALDLGCGTGLAGRAFASLCARIDGVDLSPGMLAKAREAGVYADLATDDMVTALGKVPAQQRDLVLAADALVYLGDLAPLFGEVARVLAPGGLFAFTVEVCERDYGLGAGLRYVHSEPYLRDIAAAAELREMELERVSTRKDGGVPVPGLVGVFTR